MKEERIARCELSVVAQGCVDGILNVSGVQVQVRGRERKRWRSSNNVSINFRHSDRILRTFLNSCSYLVRLMVLRYSCCCPSWRTCTQRDLYIQGRKLTKYCGREWRWRKSTASTRNSCNVRSTRRRRQDAVLACNARSRSGSV